MVKTTSCPQPGDLQKLATGHLPAAELETLVQHLESCGSCLAKVQTFASTDTLVDALIKGSTQTNGPEEPLVARLVDRLSKLAQAPPPAPGLLAFACAKCGKSLKVKPTMAGKKVKCPGCGAVVAAPAAAAAAPANVEDMRTLPPAPNPEAPTIAPSPCDVSDRPTNPSLSKPDQTMAGKPAATGHDASLTDFLSPPQAADELGRLGKYRILKILGHGGMGVVYKGEDLKLKRTVAIKAMLPTLAASASAGKRFMREAEAMAAVEHDHIVRIYQVDDERGIPFMAMEFLKGEPLDERLKHPEPIPLPDILRIGREIAEGLGAAHATGLIHRDIKPGNIWLEAARGLAFGAADANAKPQAAGRVKILDFGLARAASQDSGLTQQGAIIGTPAYMAPEQGRGDNVDARCDLFSLGVVLYRMCTGEQPFKGTDTVATLMAVAMTDPPPPIKLNDGLPHELSDLVMKLLEKDLAKRIGTAAEVVHALQGMEKHLARQKMDEDKTAALATTPVQPGEPSRVSGRLKMASTGPSRGSARRPFALIAIGLVALFSVFCLLGAGGIYYWQTNNGLVKIEINDPAIKVAFDKNGPIITGVDQKDIKLTPGEFGLTVERGDLKFDTDKFILKRGETITLKIEWFKEGKLVAMQGDKVIGAKELAKGAPITPVAAVDNALRFSGKDYVELPKDLVVDVAGNFTLEGFVSLSGRDAYLLGNGRIQVQTAAAPWGFGASADGKFLYAADKGPASQYNGRRIHLAGVRAGKEMRFFVEGRLVATTLLDDKLLVSPTKWQIGPADAVIDEIRISKVARYDKDFTPAKRFEPDADTLALYHCDEGSGDVLKDSSGNGHHGKIVGAKWVKVDGTPVAAKWALQFDGTGYVRVDAKAPVTAKKFTVEAWVNPAGLGMVYSNLFDNTMGGGTLLGTWARKNDGSACWAWNVNKHSVLYLHRESKDACIFGKWVHVAGVYDGSSFDLYLNGRRQNTPGHSAAIEFPLIGFYIGKSLFGDKVTPLGKVSAFRISKVARYTKDFTPAQRFEPDADTLALYHCDEGSGDVLHDSSGNGHHGKIVGAKWVKVDGAPVSPFPPLDPAWLKAVAAMKPEQQVEAVKAELMKRNPGFDGKMDAQNRQPNVVLNITFNTDHVKDISPVAAFAELRVLSCCGSYFMKGQLADLSPLRGLSKLSRLHCWDNPVSDLSPLQDTNLGSLHVYRTLVADLSPLKKLKLADLHCHIAKVTDLSPIKEMPLRDIDCDFNAERDDAILRSIKTLETINGKPAAEFWKEVDAGKIGALAAKKQQEEWAVKLKAPVEATNKLGMKLILIPPAGAALPKPYYLGKYEVSQGEWEQVMDYNPSAFGPKHPKMAGLDTSKFPVEQVSWFDSVEFCNKLSVREGLKPYYALTVTKRIADGGTQIDEADVKILGGSGYHIPTDAEWEHGCRAGTKTKYHCGDKDEDLLEYAWFGMNSEGRAHAVGGKKPNAFGLYDMHGNVGEWNEEMLMNATSGAPERAFRGGNWPFAAGNCAVTFRWRSGPAIRSNNCGLRVARVP